MMKNYSILVVDDEKIIRNTIGYDLREQGYNVTLAESGDDALRLFRKSSRTSDQSLYDLVITDLVMEGSDGMQVLKSAKDSNPETKVIILTGFGDLQSTIDAFKHCADDYLLKPCDPNELFLRVKRCIEKIEMQRKASLYEKILMVCRMCKRVLYDRRDSGTGEWFELEEYIKSRIKIDIHTGYCPECSKKMSK